MPEKTELKSTHIAEAAIRRLSAYYKALDVMGETGHIAVRSRDLAKFLGTSSAKVRKDLSIFGSFGHRGVGYHLASLKTHISEILGLNRTWNIVLIGSSPFSSVLMNSEIFHKKGLIITKIFDTTPELIGKKVNGIRISDLRNLETEINPELDELAIVALPPAEIQVVIDRLGKLGVKGVLYFASRSVKSPENMVVRNQDISVELGTLTYHLKK